MASTVLLLPLLLLLVLLVTGCSGSQSALDPGGPYADAIARHWWTMFGLGAAVLAVVISLFVYSIVGAKRTRPPDEPPVHAGEDDVTASAKLRAVSIGVGVTAVILVGVMIQALLVARETYAAGSDPRVDVEVTGYQWWWEVRYLDPDPSRHVVSANELHIPTGQPVRVRLRASDVIHSFWVPNLKGKIDLVPGRENEIVIQADAPGRWRGQCAEYCGLQHARMAFVVVAHAPEDFVAWRDRERQPASPPVDSLARAGEQVFLTRQCALCHSVRGTMARASTGPDLTHLASRLTLAAGTLPNLRGHLAGWILNPQSIKPGTFMPPTPLASDALQALLAYLESLQ